MASITKPRKRDWGKSRNNTSLVRIENMELDKPDLSITRNGTSLNITKQPGEEKIIKTTKSIDLQHPEMLSTEKLMELLSHYKVPIPVYSDGSPSRERIMYLYRKHVLPRPQRLRQHMRQQKFGQKGTPVAMDTTSGQDQEMEWTQGDIDKWEEPIIQTMRPINRKRSSNTDDITDLPVTKKPPITMTTPHVTPTCTSSTPTRKLKRPTNNHTPISGSPPARSFKVTKIT